MSNQFGELTIYRVEQMVLLPKTDFSLQVSISTISAMINSDIWKKYKVIIIKITISSPVIGLKKLLFSTNSLVKLLSDILLSDSSISQSHSKL